MDKQDQIDAARALGMKPREILDVVDAATGRVVTTHDGQRSHVAEDGTVRPIGPAAKLPEQVIDDDVEDEDAEGGQEADRVPAGAAPLVLAWVDGDPDRAVQALAAENTADKPRVTLIADLEKLAGV